MLMTTLHRINHPTMSSQLTQFVSVFDGSDFQLWRKSMTAYLMSQGLWSFANGQSGRPEYRPAVAAVVGQPTRPGTPNTPYRPAITAVSAQEEYTPTAAEYAAWDRSDDMAL